MDMILQKFQANTGKYRDIRDLEKMGVFDCNKTDTSFIYKKDTHTFHLHPLLFMKYEQFEVFYPAGVTLVQ